MPSTNNATAGIMIIPDADDFIKVMEDLQDAYLKHHGQTGSDDDED